MTHDWLHTPDCGVLHESRQCCISDFRLLTKRNRQLVARNGFCLMVSAFECKRSYIRYHCLVTTFGAVMVKTTYSVLSAVMH